MLDRIRSFLAVLEAGSVNRAARQLGIAQPTLSRHIQSLEQEIGGPLFERDNKGMLPTDLGFHLRDSFEPIIKNYDLALADVCAFAQGRQQQLRVGYLGMAASKFLNPALSKLKAAHPDIQLLLFDQTPAEQLQALQAGKLDVALIGQEGAAQTNDFYKRRAAKLGVCAALPAEHPLAAEPELSLAQLKGERFIGVTPKDVPGRNHWMSELCSQAGFKPRFIRNSESVTETFTLIAGENAVTLLPDYISSPPPPGVVFCRLTDKWAHWELFVLRQRGRGSAPARQLVDWIGI
ncbi:LysR family transcriptional regulator [Coraliomargarita sp. SDUM461003]|uniref:LysR family transcriptional regulator n=1 Tax=Thalassobacterium maritimum TaxID=3041265 RepID=A0ABU1B0V5_9BACT|nr:LysR family transcriptional regulator [Coraliomargarita sp. SDUM461003]MDQ8209105.1 LysR family transcriptional regulator [Coraliomargarita sp. SDUM461003]